MPPSLRAALATAAYGLLHSLLASRECKDLVVRCFGERFRNAFYRPFFILQALASFIVLMAYLVRLPEKTLYHIRGPWAWLMNGIRFAALLYGGWAAWEIGLPRLSGMTGLNAWRKHEPRVPPEPEAQGPAFAEESGMKATGPFRFSRHPLNLVPVPIFALSPKMTGRSLGFTLASAVYFWLGSKHEERRLKRAYGEPYLKYRNSGIPFYFGIRSFSGWVHLFSRLISRIGVPGKAHIVRYGGSMP
jgi:hypothetical protein